MLYFAGKVQFNLPGSDDEDSDTDAQSRTSSEIRARKKRKKKKKDKHPNKLSYAEVKENGILRAFMKKYVMTCESVEVSDCRINIFKITGLSHLCIQNRF